LPAGRVLLEPFVGAGSVFLNTDYDAYVLNDINPDLIGLYNHLKQQPDSFISEARKLFVAEHNHKTAYYRLRTQFNQTAAGFERAQLFLFLNRHGFNGLCRYNKKGVQRSFGSYKKPYFPEKELWALPRRRRRRRSSVKAMPTPWPVQRKTG
jgi:DNA adenine methylase